MFHFLEGILSLQDKCSIHAHACGKNQTQSLQCSPVGLALRVMARWSPRFEYRRIWGPTHGRLKQRYAKSPKEIYYFKEQVAFEGEGWGQIPARNGDLIFNNFWGAKTTEINFLHILKARSSKSRC